MAEDLTDEELLEVDLDEFLVLDQEFDLLIF